MNMKPTALPSTEGVRTVEELFLARVLEECLEAMEQGETDLDELASRYPEAQDEIRPLLEVAQRLRHGRALSAPLSLQFREELRGRLLSRHNAV